MKAALDFEQLVKVKNTQNEYWQFTFEMPSHDATLDITSYKDFDEPLLYGFHLTFNDKDGEPIETFNKPLTSEEFADFITKNAIREFYIAGADAVACVKSTCYNMSKEGYIVHVLSDCITSYDKRKIHEMLQYYATKGCSIEKLDDIL